MIPDRFAPVLAELAPLAARFADDGHRLYLVGGTVRDLLVGSGRHDFDIDLTTDARPPEIKSCLAGWSDAVWMQGERFGTIGAKRGDRTFEVTTFRAESYTDASRKPHVTYADEIEVDLGRRDFTVNAMALELTGGGTPTLVDPHGGAVDLVQRVLRTPLGPDVSFSDDPLRMLRAARFIAGYDLQPTDELLGAVGAMAGRLEIVSAERVRDELDKLITVDHPSAGLWFLHDTGLADRFLPELSAMRLEHDPIHRHKDVLTHTIAVVENVRPPHEQPPERPPFDFRIVRLAALFHDIGKPRTRSFEQPVQVCTTFRHHEAVGAKHDPQASPASCEYSGDEHREATSPSSWRLHRTLPQGYADWDGATAAVRRYVTRCRRISCGALNTLVRCDCTTRNAKKAAQLSRRMDDLEARIAELAAAEELAAIRPELDGTQVMEHLGIAPGREVGEALAHLLEIRLDEGLIGEDEVRKRLDAWWRERTDG